MPPPRSSTPSSPAPRAEAAAAVEPPAASGVPTSSGPPEASGPATAPSLPARLVAELLGTAFLLIAIVGAGASAARQFPDAPGLILLVCAVAVGATLTALITTLHPISAAFNPIVTLLDRCNRAITTRDALALIGAQLVGAVVGVALANLMFDAAIVAISIEQRVSAGSLLSEAVASVGLLVVIAVVVRGGRIRHLALGVGAYITAAVWFTSSTSFANPAVSIARTLTDTITGIAPASAVAFLAVQVAAVVPAFFIVRILTPDRHDT